MWSEMYVIENIKNIISSDLIAFYLDKFIVVVCPLN